MYLNVFRNLLSISTGTNISNTNFILSLPQSLFNADVPELVGGGVNEINQGVY